MNNTLGKYVSLYKDSPTAGGVDGTLLSEDRAFTSPITASLNLSSITDDIEKCAIRCNTGYRTYGTTVVRPYRYDGTSWQTSGGNIGMFKVAPDRSTPGRNSYRVSINAVSGDTISFDGTTLTFGTDVTIGSTTAVTAANIVSALNNKSLFSGRYTATGGDTEAFTITEKYAGGGVTPGGITYTGTIVIESGSPIVSTAATVDDMRANGVWADTYSISDVIHAKNVIFWLKISATSDEDATRDDSISIGAFGIIEADS